MTKPNRLLRHLPLLPTEEEIQGNCGVSMFKDGLESTALCLVEVYCAC